MNGEYIKAMDFDAFYEMALPYIKEVITKDLDLKKIAAMVKTRIEVFPDIKDHIDFFIIEHLHVQNVLIAVVGQAVCRSKSDCHVTAAVAHIRACA